MAYLVSGEFSDGGSWTASAPSNSGSQLVTVVADENISTSDRTASLLVKNAFGGVCTVSVSQEKAVYTYDFTLTASASMIGADGGTTKVRGTLVTYRSGVQVSSEMVVPTLSGSADGFSISGDVVTAANRGTTAGLVRRITVTGTYSDTFDGQEVSATVVISQAANEINRVQISTGDGTSPITSFSAAGRSNWWYYAYGIYTSGSSARISDSYSGWSLESVSWASIAPAEGATYAASFSCDSRGTEVGDARTVELSFTYAGKSDSITISQAANVVESTSIIRDNGAAAVTEYPASGGWSGYLARNYYTSGSVKEDRETVVTDFSVNQSWAVISPYENSGYKAIGLTIANRGSVIGEERVVVLTTTFGLGASLEITQAANSATALEIRELGDKDLKLNISAAGMYNYWCQLYATYTSGTRSLASMSDIEWSSSNSSILSIRTLGSTYVAIDVLTRGTEVGPVRTADLVAKYSGLETSVTFTQAKNEATTITYGVPVVSLSVSDIPASGGTVSSGIVTYSQSRVQSYSSGATQELSPLTSGGTVTYSAPVSAPSLGTTVKAKTEIGDLTATVTMNGQSGAATATVYQASNSITHYSYTNLAVSLTVADIPASGGTVSSGNPSCTQEKRTYYTSGDYTSETVPQYADVTYAYSDPVTASTLGFTEKVRTKVGELTVTATYSGRTATDTVDVYQAANEIESVKIYSSAGGAAFDGSFPASGGRHFATCRATYSSNYVGELQDGSRVAWSISGTGFSWEPSASYPWAGVVVASDRGIVVGSALSGVLTVTVGALTDSVDLTQAENKIESYNYGSWSISISANPTTIGYGGGSSTISASCIRSKTPVYSSGSTGIVETESVTPALSGSASGFTLSGTTVTAAENQSLDKRSITVTASYSGATSQSVVITQDGIPVYVYVGADQASAVSKKYTIDMPIGGSKEAIYFKVSDGSQLVTSDSNDFLVGAAEGIEDAYIASNDLFTLEKQS